MVPLLATHRTAGRARGFDWTGFDRTGFDWTDFDRTGDFRIEGHLVTTPMPTNSTCYAYFLIGLQIPGYPAPVIDLGDGVFFMSSPLAVVGPKTLTVMASSEHLGLLHTLPIPAEPSLAGLILLFQHATIHATNILLSDVFGTVILP